MAEETKLAPVFGDRIEAAFERMSERMAASREETERSVHEFAVSVGEFTDFTERKLGRFGDCVEDLIDWILIPRIRPVMHELGYNFTSLSRYVEFYHDASEGREFTLVDLFLENGDEALAIEVKTRMTVEDVEYHLERLALLREHEAGSSLRGKVLYGAMAGLEIDEDAREKAFELGMYVIEMVEDSKYVNVITPPGGVGRW